MSYTIAYGALFASLLQLIFLYGLCRFCMAMLYILCGVCPFSGQTNNFKWSLLLFYMAFSFRMVFSNFVWQLKFLMTFWIAYDLFHSVWRSEFHVVFIIPYGVSNFIWSSVLPLLEHRISFQFPFFQRNFLPERFLFPSKFLPSIMMQIQLNSSFVYSTFGDISISLLLSWYV